MRALPEAHAFAAFLERARRRAGGLAITRGAAFGFGAAAIVAWLGSGQGQSLILVAIGIGVSLVLSRRRNLAVTMDRRIPASRNLVRTAAELLDRSDAVAPYIAARVLGDASALVSRIDLRAVLPSRATIAGVAAGVGLWSAAVVASAMGYGLQRSIAGPSSPASATLLAVEIEITPPAYAGRSAQTLRDPGRIEALAGSRIRVTVTADATSVILDRINASETLSAVGRSFSTTVLAETDDYLSVAPRAADGTIGVRRLIGVSVMPDHAPRVRVTAPGRDMLLANGRYVLPFAFEADDDLGLATLRLRYTRVSGSGENFNFSEGEVPAAVARTTDRAWTARGTWALESLALEAGDMVIYRAVATDTRPGSPAAESDTFIVEIAAPGALPSEGFAIDDRQDKYAISQQMVILKTERLLAARASMTADDFLREAQGLAAEQRQVRAEFVFMMGGELADAGLDLASLNEEVEAAGEDDLAAGRLANRGRADLLRAIRSMSRAAARLAEPDVLGALPREKEALAYLQRAFSRSRYILRTLSERERLDLSRRLTGVLAALARSTRPAAEAVPSLRVLAIRRVLVDVAALAADAAGAGDSGAARAAALAERVLRIDPAAVPIREVASALTRAAALMSTRAAASGIQAEFDRVATSLAAIARADLPSDPRRGSDASLDALAGALADALRREGRPR